MPRAPKGPKQSRHDPLHVQLDADQAEAKFGRMTKQKSRPPKKKHVDGEAEEVILDSKTSRRIFELAREQQDELDSDEDEVEDDEMRSEPAVRAMRAAASSATDSDSDNDAAYAEMDEAEQVLEIDESDVHALESLLPSNRTDRRTLADIIFAKLDEDQAVAESGGGVTTIRKIRRDDDDGPPDPSAGLDPKVVDAYTKLGTYLSRHRAGGLPKIFKVLPALPAWARLMAITRPENWSPHAALAATRIFISTMKPPQAQLFLRVVLLDAVRTDTRENGRLNVQYYEALKRACFKPGAFFKGIIFPLLEEGCTLKEATIVASILPKKHLPALHCAAALTRIAGMEYSGPNSLFIRVLLDKKLEMPYQVIDTLVFHFIRLSNTYARQARRPGEPRTLPVLWHQSLLTLAQRYANFLTADQKDALLDVVRANPHHQISPEVRRELVSAPARGEGGDVDMG